MSRLVPVFFVLLWSTGFIVAKFGLPYAPPLTFLVLRCALALLVLVPLVLIGRAPWPRERGLPSGRRGFAVAGRLLDRRLVRDQAGHASLSITALIVGMQPILTAACAGLIGERVRPRQWLGLAFGLARRGAGGASQDVADRLVAAGAGLVPAGLAVDHGF
ncbi:EamA family transporter [Massilia sp. H-1]|nr:EamA family transporter [Massilia sp. H-1]